MINLQINTPGDNISSECLYIAFQSLDINDGKCKYLNTILSMHKQQPCL